MTGIGLCLPQLGENVSRSVLKDFSQLSESLGFTSLWAQEHLFYPLKPNQDYAGIPGEKIPKPYESTFSPLETLSAVAAWTQGVDLGTSVLVGGYHRPVDLAQRLATLDVLCEGRLIVGFGVGWSDDEHEQMDVDPRTRGRRLDELIRALLACWGSDPVSFSGEFFTIPSALIRPKPFRQPRPRLMSGMSSKPGIVRTATMFDYWNPAFEDDQTIADAVVVMGQIRPVDLEPIEIYKRVFLEHPLPALADQLPTLQNLASAVRSAIDVGYSEVIIDANFWREIDSEQSWVRLPQVLAKAFEEAGIALQSRP